MKPKIFGKKLVLGKKTIANIEAMEQEKIRGGVTETEPGPWTCVNSCNGTCWQNTCDYSCGQMTCNGGPCQEIIAGNNVLTTGGCGLNNDSFKFQTGAAFFYFTDIISNLRRFTKFTVNF